MRYQPAVVLLRALGLGDFLTGVPTYRAFRAAFPAHEIVLAAPAVLAPLARLTGAIDRVLPAAELRPVWWSGAPPAIAADLHGNGPASHRLVQSLQPWTAMMYASPAAPDAGGPWWDDSEHEVSRWCRLTEWWGLAADRSALHLRPPDGSAGPPVVVVHPGAASGSRRWPAGRFAAVARRLAAGGLPVVVTGSAAERPLAAGVAAAARLPPDCVLAGRTTLTELARVVASARAVISNDTGIAHLAVAFGTPSVTLYGPVSPALWGPPNDQRHVALWTGRTADGGRPGDAHGTDADLRLLQIGVPDVLTAADAAMGSSAHVAASG